MNRLSLSCGSVDRLPCFFLTSLLPNAVAEECAAVDGASTAAGWRRFPGVMGWRFPRGAIAAAFGSGDRWWWFRGAAIGPGFRGGIGGGFRSAAISGFRAVRLAEGAASVALGCRRRLPRPSSRGRLPCGGFRRGWAAGVCRSQVSDWAWATTATHPTTRILRLWTATPGSTPATEMARNQAAARHDPPVHPGGFCIGAIGDRPSSSYIAITTPGATAMNQRSVLSGWCD